MDRHGQLRNGKISLKDFASASILVSDVERTVGFVTSLPAVTSYMPLKSWQSNFECHESAGSKVYFVA